MVRREAARHPRQHRVLVQPAEPPSHRRIRHQFLEHPRPVGDRIAHPVERGPRRHPHPAAHEALARLHVEVESRAAPHRLAPHRAGPVPMIEPAGRMNLVGRLVLRESNVPVDAEHGPLGVADDLGRETRQPDVHLLDQLAHRRDDRTVVLRAMRVEPRLFVVARETAQERERRRRERHGGECKGLTRPATGWYYSACTEEESCRTIWEAFAWISSSRTRPARGCDAWCDPRWSTPAPSCPGCRPRSSNRWASNGIMNGIFARPTVRSSRAGPAPSWSTWQANGPRMKSSSVRRATSR